MAGVTFTEEISDIFATTLRHIRPTIVDNFFNSRALFVRLYERKKILLDGGRQIQQDILVDKPPAGSYGRGDELDISKKNILSALIFNWGQYYSAVTADGLDEVQNAGAAQVMNLAKIRLEAARNAVEDVIGDDLFGDGTTNNAKGIVGLKAAIDDGTNVGSYGGIARAATGTGNLIKGVVNTTGGAVSLDLLTSLMMQATRGLARPDLICTTRTLWGKIHDRLQPSQRFPSTERGQRLANAGFEVLQYMGAEIVYDDKVPSGEMYVLNTNTISFYIHTAKNFVIDGPHTPANADQKTWRIFIACQMACDNCRLNARASGLS